MKTGLAVLVASICLAGPVWADISTTRPMPRPNAEQAAAPELVATASFVAHSVRPPRRPQGEVAAQKRGPGVLEKLFGPPKKAVARRPETAPARSAQGSVCQDTAIRGTAIPAIPGAIKGCGIQKPVRVTEVDGVALSTAVTLDCDTAQALRRWVTTELKPAFGSNQVTGLRVAAHYACRSRNNKKGARISEHGRGKAIDIAAFKLADGSEVSVLKHYKSGQGKAIRTAHKGACGIFGTTLGPGSDGHHMDHLHFDTAKYRGGPYCK